MLEIVSELVILLAVAWPGLVLCAVPMFRRSFRRLYLALLALLTLYALSLTGLALWFPWGLRLGVVLAAGVLLYVAWRSRPGYGRDRGWPPGSLMLLPFQALLDQQFYQKQVNRHGPIFKLSGLLRRAAMGGPFQPAVCVYGLKRGRELLTHCEHALAAPAGPDNRYIPGGALRYMRSTHHQVYRGIFQNVFSSRVIHAHEAAFSYQARWLFTTLAEASVASASAGIEPRPYVLQMVYRTWLQVFYGLTPDSSTFTELLALYPWLESPHWSKQSDAQTQAAADRITALIQSQLHDFMTLTAQGVTPPACFLAQLLAVHPTAVDDPTALGNLIFTLNNSAQDVTGLICWLLKMLADHPAWLARLRDEVDQAVDASRPGQTLADRIVQETLRLQQSEYLTRQVIQPIQLDHFRIPAGWWLRLLIRESHRDPTIFAEPDTFNPDRWLDRGYTRDDYSPFGLSSHACLGAQLTKTVARLVLHEFARGFEWRVISDGPAEFGRYHWQPSSRFRIMISARRKR